MTAIEISGKDGPIIRAEIDTTSQESANKSIEKLLADHPELVHAIADGTSKVAVIGCPPLAFDDGTTRSMASLNKIELARLAEHDFINSPADSRNHPPIIGHICGWDNGRPNRKQQPRNSQCVCGSGKKAKKCCQYFPQVAS